PFVRLETGRDPEYPDRVPSDQVKLDVQLVPSTSADARVVEQQTADLVRELREVRGVAVERATTEAPEGAKGLDVAAIGSLLVSFAGPPGAAIAAVAAVLKAWVGRDQGRKIRVKIGDREIEIDGASPEAEKKLIAEFHAAGRG